VGGMDADAKPTWVRQAVCKALLCGAAERPPSVRAGRAPEGDLRRVWANYPRMAAGSKAQIPRGRHSVRRTSGGS
ncbi:MAG: hypothetical protein P8Y45_18990, partial [Exilibacterium sp.]